MARKRSKPQTPFGKRLEELRFSHGRNIGLPEISQSYFARLIGIQGETYGRYERGETEPSLETLTRIRQVTNVSLDYLITGQTATIVRLRTHERAS